MKRATKVNKTDRGEQEPFSKQLTRERKESARLRLECTERVTAVERKAAEEIDMTHGERDDANLMCRDACDMLRSHEKLHRDFARVVPVLRSRSILRRLWWGLRFGLWGVFGYEVKETMPNCKFDIGMAKRDLAASHRAQHDAALSHILEREKPEHDLKDLAHELFKEKTSA